MTRHTHTEDYTQEHPRVTIRTAEAWLAEQDARLSAAKPRPRDFDWPLVLQEARGFLIFAVLIGGAVYGLLSRGGM